MTLELTTAGSPTIATSASRRPVRALPGGGGGQPPAARAGAHPRRQASAPVAPQPTESVADLLTRGKALNAQNKFAEALPLFERATQLAPGSFDAWANLGLARRRRTGRNGSSDLHAYDRALALTTTQAWWSGTTKATRSGNLGSLHRRNSSPTTCALAIDPSLAPGLEQQGPPRSTALPAAGRALGRL